MPYADPERQRAAKREHPRRARVSGENPQLAASAGDVYRLLTNGDLLSQPEPQWLWSSGVFRRRRLPDGMWFM